MPRAVTGIVNGHAMVITAPDHPVPVKKTAATPELEPVPFGVALKSAQYTQDTPVAQLRKAAETMDLSTMPTADLARLFVTATGNQKMAAALEIAARVSVSSIASAMPGNGPGSML